MKAAMGCVAVFAVPGILLAYLLARKGFPGKVLVETLVHAPLVIPPVVTRYLLLVVLGNNGLVGRWLHRTFGIELAFTLNGRSSLPRSWRCHRWSALHAWRWGLWITAWEMLAHTRQQMSPPC
jgi:ABC-type Fe3+ transport system permease subunit